MADYNESDNLDQFGDQLESPEPENGDRSINRVLLMTMGGGAALGGFGLELMSNSDKVPAGARDVLHLVGVLFVSAGLIAEAISFTQ